MIIFNYLLNKTKSQEWELQKCRYNIWSQNNLDADIIDDGYSSFQEPQIIYNHNPLF